MMPQGQSRLGKFDYYKCLVGTRLMTVNDIGMRYCSRERYSDMIQSTEKKHLSKKGIFFHAETQAHNSEDAEGYGRNNQYQAKFRFFTQFHPLSLPSREGPPEAEANFE